MEAGFIKKALSKLLSEKIIANSDAEFVNSELENWTDEQTMDEAVEIFIFALDNCGSVDTQLLINDLKSRQRNLRGVTNPSENCLASLELYGKVEARLVG